MSTVQWYSGSGSQRQPTDPDLPPSIIQKHDDAAGYRPDAGLKEAVNVAIHLGQPLLLTGEPGTGKTQLAYSLAWELGLGDLLKFETKSTSSARDLFYVYDALGRFHAAQSGSGKDNVSDFIEFNALGLAILKANEPPAVAHLLNDASHIEKKRSVVLIDEIDKAPRDFPNDLLNEIDDMYFRIPEMGNDPVKADATMRPIIVLTSNSEKNLAEAFLRRCVFYDLPFPKKDTLEKIVFSRLAESATNNRELIDKAIGIFFTLRDPSSALIKKPSTSELLAWLQILVKRTDADPSHIHSVAMVQPAMASMIKNAEDRDKAQRVLNDWLSRNPTL